MVQLTAHTLNAFIAAPYLGIILLSLLAYCKEKLRVKWCLSHLNTAKVDIFLSEKFVAKLLGLKK